MRLLSFLDYSFIIFFNNFEDGNCPISWSDQNFTFPWNANSKHSKTEAFTGQWPIGSHKFSCHIDLQYLTAHANKEMN